ncbi:MAG: T9SS type A sorting domain-containing protein [Duncaniella sp.]|nr:T9SS type A sorting domain-containing protein [Duncaniella sp.]
MRRLFIILTLVLAAALSLPAATPRWESVDVVPQQVAEIVAPGSQVTHAVHDGYIYIIGSSQVQVKVFTILGQLISQETLQPGIHRLRINARGIYLLKLGSATLRVTI